MYNKKNNLQTKYVLGVLVVGVGFFIYSLSSAFAAGPGGVTSGNTLWLRADSGTSTTVDGGSISAWTDSSPATDTITQGTGVNQPTYVAIGSNYNPSVNFNGSQFLTGINTSPLGGADHAYTKIAVFNPTNIVNYYNSLIASPSGSAMLWFNGGDSFPRLWHTGDFLTGTTVGLSIGKPSIVTGQYAGGLGNALRMNSFIGTSNSVVQSFGDGPVQIGTVFNNTNFGANGKIPEVITYNRTLTSGEINQVESYLAAKYGISLDQTIATSYIASDGSTKMWDATGNATYDEDIAVIGRDDTGGLNQKQSGSVNSAEALVVARGGAIAISNIANLNTFASDKSFLSWGSNGNSFAWTDIGAPVNRNILSRIWKFQENNGDVGTVTISIPSNSSLSTIKLPPETNAVYLLSDADGDFSSGAISTPLTLNGTQWEASVNIDPVFPYVTFASEVPVVPNPTTYLDFEGDYLDNSGNGHDGLSVNGATLVTVGGDRGDVLSLDGTNDHVAISTLGAPASFTESVWLFAPTGTSINVRHIITQNSATPTLALRGDSGVIQMTDTSAGFVVRAADPTNFTTNTWIHIAVSYDTVLNTYSLYRNGIKVATGAGVDSNSVGPTYIGSYSGSGNNWLGYVDDFEVWNSALSDDQIYAVYNGDTGIVPIISAPDAPGSFTVDPGDTVVDLDWTTPLENGDPIIDYIIEYKLNSSGTWSTFSDGVSTSSFTTVTGLQNGELYDFRIFAENGIGISPASTILSATPDHVEYLHVLSTGQSLAIGMTSIPALSTVQPYSNVFSLSPTLIGFIGPLIPLVESGNLESPSSGIANSVHAFDSQNRPVVMGLHATSGAPYIDLKKGSSSYARAMGQVNATKTAVEAIGNTTEYLPIAVTVIHGEQDNFDGRAPLYQGYLEEWQNDYETDISAVVGAPVSIPLLVSQMNTGWTGEMALAQYEAHKDNPGEIVLIGPKYQYGYSDNLHLTNTESKHVGEMFAKVINQVVLDGTPWNPLMPTAVNRAGAVITVDYTIPVGSLTLDTTNVALRPDYGFEFVQTGGNSVNIDTVQLINNDTQVEITLSAIPTGTDQKIRYAYTCYAGGTGYAACGDATNPNFVGGNLRDNDTTVSPAIGSTGLPLYNWGVTFEEPVVEQSFDATLSVTQDGDETGPQDITFTVTLSGSNTGLTKTFDFDITGGTATGASDFTNSHTQISVLNGASTGSVTLSVVDDAHVEGVETVEATITNPSSGAAIIGATASADIVDNDGLVVQFGSAAYTDDEASGGDMPILVVSGAESLSSMTVDVAHAGGTATVGTDVSFTSPTTITIPAGNYLTPQNITLTGFTVNDDSDDEADETAALLLQNPSSGLAIGVQTTTTYTILDDDLPHTLSVAFDAALYADDEVNGGNIPMLEVSGGQSLSAITIDVVRTGGTASSGTDFSFSSPVTITIPAGNYSTPQTISLSGFVVIDDTDDESDETITFQLQNPSSIDLSVGPQGTTEYTILDDDAGTQTVQPRRNKSVARRVYNFFFPRSNQEAFIPVTTAPSTVPTASTTAPKTAYTFTNILNVGSVHPDVRALQEFLNSQGFTVSETGPGSKGQETNLFGVKTKNALIKFQESHATEILQPLGLTKGTGKLGPKTMAVINSMTQ